MQLQMKWYGWVALLVAGVSLLSCVTYEDEPNTNEGNVEACWKILDEHYCFFGDKKKEYGLDWNEVHAKYAHAIGEDNSEEQLFEVLEAMICELKDGHVNVAAPFDVARYADWYDCYPTNFADTLVRKYLGASKDYSTMGAFAYRTLPSNMGYIRCSTFKAPFGSGNLSDMISRLKGCNGLIIDVRNNGGGMLTSAQKLASVFMDKRTCLGYIRHKTGPGHEALSDMRAVWVDAFEGMRWQKPVCVLTNRHTFSAANAFVAYMKELPNVTIVGDKTGGGAGLPFSSELPNGWVLRFSASPMYDVHQHCTEEGIDPDVRVDISSEDYQKSVDSIIETAIRWLQGEDVKGNVGK